MQCAVIEFARNELKWNNANSVEINEDTKYPVVYQFIIYFNNIIYK